MTRIKIIIYICLFLVLLVGALFNRVSIKEFVLDWQKPNLPVAKQYSDVIASPLKGINSAKQSDSRTENIPENNDKIATVVSTLPRNDNTPIPLEYNLAVPFQSQAPTMDWGLPYQEACEEASLIMADAFYNKTSLTAGEMDERIKTLVDWETKKFGYYKDTTAAEVAVIAKEYFGLKAELDYNVSVDNIKKYVSQNKLVLVPAAGKILPNPYFRSGGPLYHMLVIRGYTQDKFITNDPGTKRGKEFVYKYNDLINAIHDWPKQTGGGKQGVTEAEMLTGEKVMIVVDKPL